MVFGDKIFQLRLNLIIVLMLLCRMFNLVLVLKFHHRLERNEWLFTMFSLHGLLTCIQGLAQFHNGL